MKPHQNTELAKFIERRVLELKPKKTQAEIAAQSGCSRKKYSFGTSDVARDNL